MPHACTLLTTTVYVAVFLKGCAQTDNFKIIPVNLCSDKACFIKNDRDAEQMLGTGGRFEPKRMQ